MTDAVTALEAHVRAFNERDLDALLAGFTGDATWITGTTTIRGRGTAHRDVHRAHLRDRRFLPIPRRPHRGGEDIS